MTPYKKRALEMMDSTATNSAPGSGPSSPIGASSALGAENGPSSLPTTTKTEVQTQTINQSILFYKALCTSAVVTKCIPVTRPKPQRATKAKAKGQ
eukprot:XP_014057344.1 PREDICTED: histone deacetylase 9-B-like [Salmo salar]